MDPRFNVYVTYIPEESDNDSGDDGDTTSGGGSGSGRDIEPSPFPDPGLKNRAGVPIKGGKARRRSGSGRDAGSDVAK